MNTVSERVTIQSRQIAVHGISVRLECSDEQILSWFEFDFRAFQVDQAEGKSSDSTEKIRLRVYLEQAPPGTIPELDEVMHTPQFVCFDQDTTRYVNYQGKALVIWDYANEAGWIYAEDPVVAYEKLYLTLLSRIGEKLDYRGLHRVHSLGISYRDAGCLFLIPQGGGKTTLALSLLNNPAVKLLSEDTPFITGSGRIFPFPFRLGVTNGENTDSIPDEFKRIGERKAGGYKILIDPRYFSESIAKTPVQIKYLFCGRWTTAQTPRIVPMSKIAALQYMIRDCVFGLGLPQVIEFFLQAGIKACAKKGFIAASRMAVSVATVLRSRCYQAYLCSDREKNVTLVATFLNELRWRTGL